MYQDLPVFCQTWANAFFNLAWWLVLVAFGCGVLYVLADIYIKLKLAAATNGVKPDPETGGGVIESAKALIEALTKAPPWFALFVGAVALVWVVSSQIPRSCMPVTPTSNGDRNDAPPAPSVEAPSQSKQTTKTDAESGG